MADQREQRSLTGSFGVVLRHLVVLAGIIVAISLVVLAWDDTGAATSLIQRRPSLFWPDFFLLVPRLVPDGGLFARCHPWPCSTSRWGSWSASPSAPPTGQLYALPGGGNYGGRFRFCWPTPAISSRYGGYPDLGSSWNRGAPRLQRRERGLVRSSSVTTLSKAFFCTPREGLPSPLEPSYENDAGTATAARSTQSSD
jgi:hypothetical protein